tara:strand:- start:5152 stop:5427 length:276 start_codon:yes stop_codon:yes gene_type:complete
MSKVTVAVECSKETLELGQGLADFLGALKVAMADGWQPFTDVPAIVAATVSKLVPALVGSEKVKGEFAEDKSAFFNAAMVTGSKILGVVTK